MTPEQANLDLELRLGRNPLGRGLYRWMHSDNWWHLMKIQGETKTVERFGLYIVEPVYRYRRMVDLENTWILAHWHGNIGQDKWEREYPNLLWPREGYYAPTNILLAPGEEITETSNDQAVYLIKMQRERTMPDLLAESEAMAEKKDRDHRNLVADQIDDSVSAFANVPGTRSAHVSFPSVERNK